MAEVTHREGSDVWWSLWKERLGEHGKPLVGKVRFYFSSLSQMKEDNQSFYAKFFLTVDVVADCLLDKVGPHVDWWNPKFIFSNSVSDVKIEKSVRKNRKENKLTFYYQVEGEFEDAYDLRFFPWDRQELEVALTTDWDDQFLILEPAQDENGETLSEVDTKNNISISSKWDLEDKVRVQLKSNDSARYKYSQLNATIFALRRPWAYIATTWLRTFVVTSLAFSSFAIDLGDAPSRDRLSVVVGLLLTLSIGFKKDNGLVTWLDAYTIVSFVTLAIILSYHGFGVGLVPNPDIDSAIFITLAIIWIGINVAFWGVAIYARAKNYLRRKRWAKADIKVLFATSRDVGIALFAPASAVLDVVVDAAKHD